mmetsp:Transcript_30038/g.84615  ORF Transcript_30038/g.84615 Transcript_30038/m.84615 type:complete len:221 (-) Transcript_30038:2666-3328(-)
MQQSQHGSGLFGFHPGGGELVTQNVLAPSTKRRGAAAAVYGRRREDGSDLSTANPQTITSRWPDSCGWPYHRRAAVDVGDRGRKDGSDLGTANLQMIISRWTVSCGWPFHLNRPHQPEVSDVRSTRFPTNSATCERLGGAIVMLSRSLLACSAFCTRMAEPRSFSFSTTSAANLASASFNALRAARDWLYFSPNSRDGCGRSSSFAPLATVSVMPKARLP